MASKKESALRAKFIKWIKANGGDAHAIHGSPLQRRGEPDIDGWIKMNHEPYGHSPYLHLKIEVKTPGNVPTEQQFDRMVEYVRAGYYAFWMDNYPDFVKLMTELKDTGRLNTSLIPKMPGE